MHTCYAPFFTFEFDKIEMKSKCIPNSDFTLKVNTMDKKNKNYYVKISLLLIIMIAVTVLMLPKGKINEFSNYKVGLLAPEKVTSPFDFEILRSDDELKEVRAKIRSTVLPVFIYSDTLNLNLYRNYSKFYRNFDELRQSKNSLDAIAGKKSFYELKKDSLIKKDSIDFLANKQALDSIFLKAEKEMKTKEFVFKQNFS